MKFGSVCSGVEAASLAWMPLGWECKFVSEIEPFPCAVLQHRFGASAPINQLDPNEIIITDEEWALIDELKKVNKDWMKACDNADLISRFKERKQREAWMKDNALLNKEGKIPNEGDFTKIGKKYAGQIDLLVGGTPCQDLSIAGKRTGFDGERSSLAIDFVRLAYESQCKWFVWENVPGVFSSNEGRDFATLLSLFTGSKVEVPKDGWGTAGFVCNARRDRYGVAWRTLDGQFTRTQQFPFAVPQRRRRVFLIGYFGDWTRAAEVLLEPGRSKWDTPSRFKAREIFAEIARADSALADRELRGTESGSTDRHWDASGVNPTLNQCNAGSGTPGASNQELFAQNFNGLVTSMGEKVKATFWNGNDVAECLKANCDRDRMPDKGKLPCVIEQAVGCDMYNSVICRATQQSNAETMVDACPTITEAAGTSGNNQPIICLNDQGGSLMSVESDGNAGTLRANTHGNEQIVCGAFLGQMGAKAHGIGYEEEIAPTVNTGQLVDIVSTLKIRSGCEGGGKGPLVQDELSATQGCGNDQTLFVVHGARTPINNDEEYANPLGCCNDGLENVISMHNQQFGQCEENIASTLLSTDYKEPQVLCYENHANDSRITESNDVSPLISSRAGTGGGNLPLVQECIGYYPSQHHVPKPCDGGDNYNTVITKDAIGLDGYNAALTGNSSATLGVNCGMSTGKNGVINSIAFEPGIAKRDGGDSRFTDDLSHTLRSNAGDNQTATCIAIDGDKMGKAERKGGSGMGVSEKDVMYTQTAKDVHAVCTNENKNIKDLFYGDAEEKRAYEVLFVLWKKIGKSAFCEWAIRRFGSIQETKILQPDLHGQGIRCETCEKKSLLDDGSLSCEKADSERFLLFLWKRFQSRHSSHRPELAKQFIEQLTLRLSELSYKNSSQINSTVRRLLPIETERLMGFPDNHTRIPWKGLKEEDCPDSPRYKACGNSFCVNVVQWIGEQIDKVEKRK